MALVTYSDSDDSDEEQQVKSPANATNNSTTATTKVTTTNPQSNKIKVNLPHVQSSENDDVPAAKRPRIGAGTFTGFNSMLPAPKHDNVPSIQNQAKLPTRKVFSLKTGAEAAFSRESDAELRSAFAEQNGSHNDDAINPTNSLKPLSFAKPAPPSLNGAFLFKPLSVARCSRKKKPTTNVTSPPTTQSQNQKPENTRSEGQLSKQKISLFSTTAERVPFPAEDEVEDVDAIDAQTEAEEEDLHLEQASQSIALEPQSLDTIASDLKLSKAERRQLFGRNTSHQAIAHNVINFNTDAEYAANQQLIAQGETVQHNPVRGIAPGKHSLRQLVNAASGQKEALEESFAQGKRNKKEAGNKYGW